MPWPEKQKKEVEKLCNKYGYKANKKKKHMWCGFRKGMVFLVFEHSCPNNTPLILWEKKEPWKALFKDRTIDTETQTVFPEEISRGDPILTLLALRQKKLAYSGALVRRGEIGQMLLIFLALIARGKRKISTLCFSTGLSTDEVLRFIETCKKWKYIDADMKTVSYTHLTLPTNREV